MHSAREEANLRLVERVCAEVLGPLDLQTVEALFSPRFVQHDPALASGIPALKDHLDRLKALHPRATCAVKRMMANGDLVMAHVHVVHEPGSPGMSAIHIFRIERDLVAEHWAVAQPVETKPRNGNGMF